MRELTTYEEAAIGSDLYFFLVMGAAALVVLYLVTFVVRKLIGLALVFALIIGSWAVWNDPWLLQDAFQTVSEFIHGYV